MTTYSWIEFNSMG